MLWKDHIVKSAPPQYTSQSCPMLIERDLIVLRKVHVKIYTLSTERHYFKRFDRQHIRDIT